MRTHCSRRAASVLAGFALSLFSVTAALIPSPPIQIRGQTNVVINNLKITSTTGDCVVITNATNVVIRASEIGPCKGNGIVVAGGSQISIYDSYIHPEGILAGCCDHTDGIYAKGVNGLNIQGDVIAYGESNIEILSSTGIRIEGNALLNPRNSSSRGHQIQVAGASSDIMIDSNYMLSSGSSEYAYPANQEDGINLNGDRAGPVSRSTIQNNYITGGASRSGCGIIADGWVEHTTVQYNTLVDTGQCGLSIAGGTDVTFTNNRVHNTTPVAGGGNTALTIWNVYRSSGVQCDSVAMTNNVASAVNTLGRYNSYWYGGGCINVTFSGNTLNGAANMLLTPVSTVLPPPKIPPVPYGCIAPAPYANQTGVPLCVPLHCRSQSCR